MLGRPAKPSRSAPYRRGWALPPSPAGTACEASASPDPAKAAPEATPASAAELEWWDQQSSNATDRNQERDLSNENSE